MKNKKLTKTGKYFTLTQQHLDLFKKACVEMTGAFGEKGSYFPNIGLDHKRPFGNSNIVDDMSRILNIHAVEMDDGEKHWPKGTTEECERLFVELRTALQIILSVQSFVPGLYEADNYSENWRLVTQRSKK